MLQSLWKVLPLFVVFISYIYGGLKLANIKSVDPLGVQFYPLFLAFLGLGLSMCVVFKDVKDKKGSSVKVSLNDYLSILGIIALSFMYLLALDSIGFFVLTPIYIILMLTVLKFKEWKRKIIISIGTTIAIYIVFGKVFHVLLPHGILKFF